ncbi:MAG: OB-fold nucleic acid binding domain-containing protein, partial [Armatimonadota bacterium]
MDYRRQYIKDLFLLSPGVKASAFGWVKTRRDSKGITFVQLSDGSCFKDLQVVVDEGSVDADLLKTVTTGACVRFDGEIVESPAAGQAVELKA